MIEETTQKMNFKDLNKPPEQQLQNHPESNYTIGQTLLEKHATAI